MFLGRRRYEVEKSFNIDITAAIERILILKSLVHLFHFFFSCISFVFYFLAFPCFLGTFHLGMSAHCFGFLLFFCPRFHRGKIYVFFVRFRFLLKTDSFFYFDLFSFDFTFFGRPILSFIFLS